MAPFDLAVHVFPTFRRRITRRWLQMVVEHTLDSEVVDGVVELELVIADDVTVRRLNKEYLGQDEVTDVLAFGFHTEIGDDRRLGEAVQEVFRRGSA